MANPKTLLKGDKKEGYGTIRERFSNEDEHRAQMTELGLNEDDIRRRDEEAKTGRIHFSNASEKTKEKIGKNSEHLDYEIAMKELRRVRAADPCETQSKPPPQQQPQQQHTHTSPWQWWNSNSWNHRPWSDDQRQSSSSSHWKEHWLISGDFFKKPKKPAH